MTQFVWENGTAEVETLDDVIKHLGPLQADGYGVVLYIKDHGSFLKGTINDPSRGNRVHLVYCSKLAEMERDGRFERYHLKREPDGEFLISGSSFGTDTLEREARLWVCKYCLKQLNYRDYRKLFWPRDKDAAARNFDFDAFSETYSTFFPRLPTRDEHSPVGYPGDWREISKEARVRANYNCDACQTNLRGVPQLLHTHHINGVKSDNSKENLRVLCVACHRRQPRHDILHATRREYEVIHSERKRQGKHPSTATNLDDYLDPAWLEPKERIIQRCRENPEPYYDLADEGGVVICNLDLAFLGCKIGLISEYTPQISEKAIGLGWTLMTHNQAML